MPRSVARTAVRGPQRCVVSPTMGNVIGELLPLAVALATGPLPIIALMLILTSAGATAKGLAFVGGRITGLTVLVVAALAVLVSVDDPNLFFFYDTSTFLLFMF